jgi:hypothetical protein
MIGDECGDIRFVVYDEDTRTHAAIIASRRRTAIGASRLGNERAVSLQPSAIRSTWADATFG